MNVVTHSWCSPQVDVFGLHRGWGVVEGCFLSLFLYGCSFCSLFLFRFFFPVPLARELLMACQSYGSSFCFGRMTTRGRNLHFISWNLKVANQPIKSNKVMTHNNSGVMSSFYMKLPFALRRLTVLSNPGQGICFTPNVWWRWEVWLSSIHRNVPFELSTSIEDTNGWFVIFGKLCGMPAVMACVYVPTWDDDKFIMSFTTLFPKLMTTTWLLGATLI